MAGWVDAWVDKWIGGNGWVSEWMGEWMDGWVNGWMGEWMDGWMDGWVNGWLGEWMTATHWTSVRMRTRWEWNNKSKEPGEESLLQLHDVCISMPWSSYHPHIMCGCLIIICNWRKISQILECVWFMAGLSSLTRPDSDWLDSGAGLG